MCEAIRFGDMKVLSVAFVSGFIERHLHCDSNFDAYKARLISETPTPCNVCVSFKECGGRVHSLSIPPERLVKTVGAAVTVLEGMMSEVAHLQMVQLCITDAIKERVNFDCIRLTGCSLHYQGIKVETVMSVIRISIPWKCKWNTE